MSRHPDRSNLEIWLGGNDLEKEGEWRWVTGEEFRAEDWFSTGEPDNRGEDGEQCMAMNSDGAIYDVECGRLMVPACQFYDKPDSDDAWMMYGEDCA